MKPWIRRITLKRGDVIELRQTSILAIVGPNNSGKSHFLVQLLGLLYGDKVFEREPDDGLIRDLTIDWDENSDDARITKLIALASSLWSHQNSMFSARLPEYFEHNYQPLYESEIANLAVKKNKLGPFVDHFTRWDEPHSRIRESEKQKLDGKTSAAIALARNKEEFDHVRDLFHTVFGTSLSIHDLRDGEIGYILGEGPAEASPATGGLDAATKQFMLDAPKMWYQGSGLRNVFGLLTRIKSDNRPIIIMDEPEAFLHPEQAFELGVILAQLCQKEAKQLVCATHDRNFLTGLAHGSENNILVCRLDSSRDDHGPAYSASLVPTEFWTNVRHQSRVRFSTVLDSLFASSVVLVEAERDALFYQQATDFFLKNHPEHSNCMRGLMFLPIGGNAEFAPMAGLVKSLGPRVIAIGDLDLIASKDRFERTVKSFTNEPVAHITKLRDDIEEVFVRNPSLGETDLDRQARLLQESLENEKSEYAGLSTFANAEALLKLFELKRTQQAKNSLQNRIANHANIRSSNETVRELVSEITMELSSLGIFLLPWGELEHFDEELLKAGKQDWVRHALDKGVHESDRVQMFIASALRA